MRKYLNLRAYIALGLLIAFLVNTIGPMPAYAQDFVLPVPGTMVSLSPSFNPPILKGIKVHPDNPFRFEFILDKGDSLSSTNALKDESNKLIRYFLASLTIPEKDLWVNLSPYEKDRIVPNTFGVTEMGRDLLAEDYMLKQITASLIYPEGETGKKFWQRIYAQAAERFGTTQIPVNTFNKVWIVPEKAVVYENAKAGTAYVVESKLKVMLEQDYLSMQKHGYVGDARGQDPNISALGSQIIREIVIPELTKEVNEGRNFAQLRQVYNSLILATWYKKKIKDSILAQVYENRNKVAGVSIDDPQEKERIYQRYLQAFKKGAYNYIKEETDPITQQPVPRKYFSGGVKMTYLELDAAMVTTRTMLPANQAGLVRVTADFAMVTQKDVRGLLEQFFPGEKIVVGRLDDEESLHDQEIRRQWENVSTDPRQHDPQHFCYIVHGIKLPDSYAETMLQDEKERANIPEEYRDSIDLYDHPEHISQRKMVSVSLISEKHRYTFTPGGFILKVPSENIVKTEYRGILGPSWQNLVHTSFLDELIPPRDLLKSPFDFLNEALTAGTGSKGRKIEIQAVFVKVFNDKIDHLKKPVDPVLAGRLKVFAEQHGWPVVEIDQQESLMEDIDPTVVGHYLYYRRAGRGYLFDFKTNIFGVYGIYEVLLRMMSPRERDAQVNFLKQYLSTHHERTELIPLIEEIQSVAPDFLVENEQGLEGALKRQNLLMLGKNILAMSPPGSYRMQRGDIIPPRMIKGFTLPPGQSRSLAVKLGYDKQGPTLHFSRSDDPRQELYVQTSGETMQVAPRFAVNRGNLKFVVYQGFRSQSVFIENLSDDILVLTDPAQASGGAQMMRMQSNARPKNVVIKTEDRAMKTSFAVEAGLAERGFRNIIYDVLNGIKPIGPDGNVALSDRQWADFADSFIHKTRAVYGAGMIDDNFEKVIKAFFRPGNISALTKNKSGFEFDNLVLIIQHLHAFVLDKFLYSVRIDMLGTRIFPFPTILQLATFSYALNLDILEASGFFGKKWNAVVADKRTKRLLAQNQFVELKDRKDNLAKKKAMLEYYGISLPDYYQHRIRDELMERRNDIALYKDERLAPYVINDVSTYIGALIEHDLYTISHVNSGFYHSPEYSGMKFMKFLGNRGVDGLAILVINKGKRSVLKVNTFYNDLPGAKAYEKEFNNLDKLSRGAGLFPDVEGFSFFKNTSANIGLPIEVNEFVDGPTLDSVVRVRAADYLLNIRQWINDFVHLHEKLLKMNYVDRDINNMDNIIVRPSGQMVMVDRRNIVPAGDESTVNYKNSMIINLAYMMSGMTFGDLNDSIAVGTTSADKWATVKHFAQVDFKDQQLAFVNNGISFLRESYVDKTLDLAGFFEKWDKFMSNSDAADTAMNAGDRAMKAGLMDQVMVERHLLDFIVTQNRVRLLRYVRSYNKEDNPLSGENLESYCGLSVVFLKAELEKHNDISIKVFDSKAVYNKHKKNVILPHVFIIVKFNSSGNQYLIDPTFIQFFSFKEETDIFPDGFQGWRAEKAGLMRPAVELLREGYIKISDDVVRMHSIVLGKSINEAASLMANFYDQEPGIHFNSIKDRNALEAADARAPITQEDLLSIPGMVKQALSEAEIPMDDFAQITKLGAGDRAMSPTGSKQTESSEIVSQRGKRAMDLLLASIVFPFSLLPIAIMSILIKLDSRGPVFYRSKRVGLKGQEFYIYKFRTLEVGADLKQKEFLRVNNMSANELYKLNDKHITGVGKWSRKIKLDELPQIWNVLKGEMSFVGPRPLVPEQNALLSQNRTKVLPGITGLHQIRNHGAVDFKRKERIDEFYIKHWSLSLDMKILYLTSLMIIHELIIHNSNTAMKVGRGDRAMTNEELKSLIESKLTFTVRKISAVHSEYFARVNKQWLQRLGYGETNAIFLLNHAAIRIHLHSKFDLKKERDRKIVEGYRNNYQFASKTGIAPPMLFSGRIRRGNTYIATEAVIGESLDRKKKTSAEDVDMILDLVKLMLKEKVYVRDIGWAQIMIGYRAGDPQQIKRAWLVDTDEIETDKSEQDLIDSYHAMFKQYAIYDKITKYLESLNKVQEGDRAMLEGIAMPQEKRVIVGHYHMLPYHHEEMGREFASLPAQLDKIRKYVDGILSDPYVIKTLDGYRAEEEFLRANADHISAIGIEDTHEGFVNKLARIRPNRDYLARYLPPEKVEKIIRYFFGPVIALIDEGRLKIETIVPIDDGKSNIESGNVSAQIDMILGQEFKKSNEGIEKVTNLLNDMMAKRSVTPVLQEKIENIVREYSPEDQKTIRVLIKKIIGYAFEYNKLSRKRDLYMAKQIAKMPLESIAFVGRFHVPPILKILKRLFGIEMISEIIGDDAMLTPKDKSNVVQISNQILKGGIDLTSDKALTVQNNGQGIKFHLDPAQLKQLQDAPGFVPVIISIQPMTNLKAFLTFP